MSTEQTVFVVDDDNEARESVCVLVRSMGIPCVGFESAEAFLVWYDPSRRGCLVTDLRMRGMSGLELQEEIARRKWPLPIVVVSGYINVNHAVRAMKCGAENVLEKPYRSQELWDSIQAALRGEIRMRQEAEQLAELRRRFEQLTPEETQVLDLITAGLPNKAVARRLNIALRTVEDRRRRVMEKVGVDSFAELVTRFAEFRWLDPKCA